MMLSVFAVSESYTQADYERIAGKNRIETAVEISKEIQNRSKVAVLANSTKYIDALAGSTLANLYEAPILLVERNSIPKATLDEMKRLGVEKVYLLGGNAVISEDLEDSLGNYEVERLYGQNRYETSFEIYKEIKEIQEIDMVFVAAKEVDAVASAATREKNIPLLLVSENVPAFVKEVKEEKIVLGGRNAVSKNAYERIGAVDRIAGVNRFETAVLLARKSNNTNTILVNAYNFVDAFTSGTFAYRKDGNILLTATTVLPKETKGYIDKENKGKLYLIGGEAAISDQIFTKEIEVDTGDPTNPLDIAYWDKYNQYGKTILLNPSQIAEYNRTLDQKSDDVFNILEISNKFSASWIIDRINSLKMPANPTRENGSSYSGAEISAMLSNRNMNAVGLTTAKYGIPIQRTLMRTFPTYNGNVKSGYFDYFTEDAVNPWDKLMILHTSRDNNWYFVLTETYAGWVPVKDIAITTKDELLKYEKSSFYIVTEPKINLNGWNMDMGTRLPMKDDRPLLPRKDAQGRLIVSGGNKTAALHKGYLPYTEYSLIKQALKFEGEPYGWAGSRNAHDCSSFIEDAHKVFGFILPRNTWQQEPVLLGNRVSIRNKTNSEKISATRKSGTSSVIYMKGHVVLYLGKDASGADKIIHQNGSTRDCAITNLNFNGNYLASYTTIQRYR